MTDEQFGLVLRERMAEAAETVVAAPRMLDGARRRYRARRMRSAAAVAVAAVGVVALVAAVTDGGLPRLRTASPASPQPGPSGLVSADPEQLREYDQRFGRDFPLPLDAYRLSQTEALRQGWALDVLTDRCLIAKGYTYRADKDLTFDGYVLTSALMDLGDHQHRRLYGPTNLAAAEAYGLQFPSLFVLGPQPAEDPAYRRGFRTDAPGLDQAFDDCQDAAWARFVGIAGPEPKLTYDSLTASKKDPQFAQVYAGYGACMRRGGYPDWHYPDELPTVLSLTLKDSQQTLTWDGTGDGDAARQQAERQLAVTSVHCTQQTQIVDTWWKVQTRLEESWIAGHQAEVADAAAWKSRALAFVDKTLSGTS